jgi:hypothetical protein
MKQHVQRMRVQYPISDVRLLRYSTKRFKAECAAHYEPLFDDFRLPYVLRVGYSPCDAVVGKPCVEGENTKSLAISQTSG